MPIRLNKNVNHNIILTIITLNDTQIIFRWIAVNCLVFNTQ
nr:MAG TPA_asm: putative bacterial toxin [Caudoviricetes sp.]